MRIIEPMLAKLSEEPIEKLEQSNYLFEWKYDGTRAVAHIDNGLVTFINRHGNDITIRYPELANIAENIDLKTAILDGEIVCFGDDGLPNWSRMQQRIGKTNPVDVKKAMKEYPVCFMAFDIIEANGIDLTSKGEATPYVVRKDLLNKYILGDMHFRVARHVTNGTALYAKVEELGDEGIMAKRADSIYYEGKRSSFWKKIKPRKKDVFVVCGYTHGTGSRASQFGALVLGKPTNDGKYRYVGRAGSGLTDAELGQFAVRLLDLKTDENPMVKGTKVQKLDSWVKPEIVVEVFYYEISNDGKLRWPIFSNIMDVAPSEVTSEIRAIIA